MGCQRPSRFWGLGCPKIYHEAEDTLDTIPDGHTRINGNGATGYAAHILAHHHDRRNEPLVTVSGTV
ncbi:hypothetical protein, partial [Thiolapillus sp.]|uniref:hypothetical protein n=1 Tax=Thiolapillus sp. TaxID=2017437 RepID=UPI003AF5EADA